MKRSLRSWLWHVPLEREVDEEIAFHIEMRTRELVEKGMDPKDARETVLARLGDLGRLKRTCVDLGRKSDREMRVTQWLQECRDDVKFAIRQMKTSPAFTLVAVLTLALGIGANSAMFALADATLLRPLPYANADRLVMAWERNARSPRIGASPANLKDWNEGNRTFEVMAGIANTQGGGPLLTAPDGTVESVERQFVTARFFDVLGLVPIAGRTFNARDLTVRGQERVFVGDAGNPNVVVMSEGLWRTRFGGDPSLIGRDIRLNGQPHTVIGIIADEVQFARPARIWAVVPDLDLPRAARFLQVVGRLKPGVTIEAARADLSVIQDRLAREFPATNKDFGVTVEPLRNGIMGQDLQITSLFLLGVLGFVLLMCCANVANLLLARASVRAREIALRSSLGAGRSRIVRQLLTESVVLAALGGALGIAVGAAILRAAPALIPPGLLPAAVLLSFDARVLTFCIVAAFAVGIIFGLAPAWQASRTSLMQAMASDSRATTHGSGRLRSLLVVTEVSAAVLLLCGAGLLVRTLLVLGSFESGYRAPSASVVTMDFSLPPPVPGSRYPTQDSLLQFYDQVAREVSALPDVRSVGWTTALPLGPTELGTAPFEIAGDAPVELQNRPMAAYQVVSPEYFTTLDLPAVAGRLFNDRDTRASTPVCIVNEAFARRYLLGRDPIGVRVSLQRSPSAPPEVRHIVGIARQVKGRRDEREDVMHVYVPLAQNTWSETFLVVRTAAGHPETIAPAIRALVARRDPNLSVRRIKTLEVIAQESTAGYRFRAVMLVTFGGLALVLAMVGVFGILKYSVQQRSREFGVRIALGATAADVLGLVLGNAARIVTGGVGIGLVLAALLSRSISTFLFGVQPLDAVTFVSVAMLLVVTAAIATAAPAIRATRVDPVVAFRNE